MNTEQDHQKKPTWKLSKDFTFEAAHKLPLHDGKCARLHGHSWKMTVEVESDRLQTHGPKVGMVMDFGEIKAVAGPLIETKLDHYKEPETWNVWAGSWSGAQFLGQGKTEDEAWQAAAKTALGPKTRTVRCRSCFEPLEIPESAHHPGFCKTCRMNETTKRKN